MSKGSVVVVDDDQAVLESIVSLLSIDGYRVSGFTSARAFLDEAADLSFDCLITDIRMPGIDGLGLVERLQQLGLGHKPTVMVSGHANVPIAVAAMQLGASTVLEKPFPPARLLEATAKAIASAAQLALSSEWSQEQLGIKSRYETLSPREREALSHLLNGSSSKVAAIAMGISHRTVDVFRASILRKMKSPNLASVAAQVSMIKN